MRLGALLLLLALVTPGAGAPRRSRRSVRAEFPLGSAAILDKPDRLILYAIDPAPAAGKTPASFHGYPVLKQKQLDARTGRVLVEALFGAMQDQQGGARCFVPHHGLRAVRAGKTVDLVLCFTCQWVDIHHAGRRKRAPLAAKPVAHYDRALR